jgi:hypothetical protein
MALKYKTSSGGTLTDIPSYALAGTYAGGYDLVYPPAPDLDGLGIPCGIVGLPDIVIQAPRLSGTGFEWWRALFGTTATVEHKTIWLQVRNARSGEVETWTGNLLRPTYAKQHIGSTDANTW